MNKQDAIADIEVGLANVRILDPNYKPDRRHTWADRHIAGTSIFYVWYTKVEDAIAKAKEEGVELIADIQEDAKTRILIFRSSEDIGEFADPLPVPAGKYIMKKEHGMLQPIGLVVQNPVSTNEFTIVLTLEVMPDGTQKWCLASLYPGRPDPRPRGGQRMLQEGDEITAYEVLLLRLRPKEPAN